MYVAVKGGEAAIDNAHRLLADKRRGDRSLPAITIEQIVEQLALSVDRQIRQLRLQADAVRSEDDAAGHHRVGLKLVDLPPESLDLLERYLGVLR